MSSLDASPVRAKIRVTVAVPAQDNVNTGFAYDLARLMGFTAARRPDVEMRLTMLRGSILPASRQSLVGSALEAESTHILFLDSDMRFPKDALIRLLEHREPIVAANYVTRRLPLRFTAVLASGEELVTDESGAGLEEVSHVGFGLVLIDLEVFRALPLPWFLFGYEPDEQLYFGEDVWFASVAREHGLKILVDQSLSREVAHAGEWEYRHAHLAAMRRNVDGTE